MAKKLYANVSQYATPTDGKHLVNLETVQRMIDRKLKNAVRGVITLDIDATYNSTDKTLTNNNPTVMAFDGVTYALGDRVLIAGQNDATQNGIYEVTTLGTTSVPGVLTRAYDWADSADIVPNVIIPVMEGTENGDTNWQLVNDTSVTLDTTPVTFAKFTGDNTGVHSFKSAFAGDGATTSFTITHGLNSEAVEVAIYDKATKELCGFNVEITSANVVTISSDVVLTASDEFDVVVIG